MATSIESLDDFKSFIAASQGKVVALYFWAPWATPCVKMNTVFDELAAKFPDTAFAKVQSFRSKSALC